MAAHRYWRLWIRTTSVGSYVCISELDFRATIGGSDQCAGGTAIESGHYPTLDAARAFDNDAETDWGVDVYSAPAYLGYDFGADNDKEVEEVMVKARAYTNDGPSDFTLEYSDDGTTWYSKIHFFNQAAFTAAYQEKTYNYTNTNAIVGVNRAPSTSASLTTPSPYVISCSSNHSSFPCWLAFDGNYTTQWITNGSPTGWIKIDRADGNEAKVSKLVIRASDTNRAPNDFTLKGSNDDTNWTTISTQTDQSSWAAGELRYFDCTDSTEYRYFMLDVTANNGDASYLQISDIFLIEVIGASGRTTKNARSNPLGTNTGMALRMNQ